MTEPVDWDRWHDPYADPTSGLSRRLLVIQAALTRWLEGTAPTPVRLLSVCAGDGRDVVDVLRTRQDASRVQATLLELDPRNVHRARHAIQDAGLRTVQVRQCDAGLLTEWASAAPVDLLLLAGVFGNIDDHDVYATIAALPHVCAPGAVVIWTRHRKHPDLTGPIRAWLGRAGFAQISFTAPADAIFTVGVHRLIPDPPPAAAPAARLFTFTR